MAITGFSTSERKALLTSCRVYLWQPNIIKHHIQLGPDEFPAAVYGANEVRCIFCYFVFFM